MIDSHCHLVDEKYDVGEIDGFVQRAKEAGVTKFVSAGAGFEHTKQTIIAAEKYSDVYVTVGMGYEPDEKNNLIDLKAFTQNKKVVAIGECGLDYWPSMTDELRAKQKNLFAQHISLAKEVSLPVVVHCRNAFEDVYRMLKDINIIGQMHCFTGTSEWMKKFVDLGWYISFGGIVTFKKSNELRDVLRQTPQERILIETDSPYLAPEPIRSQRNEPANLEHIVEVISEARHEPFQAVVSYTTQNAVRLFRL